MAFSDQTTTLPPKCQLVEFVAKNLLYKIIIALKGASCLGAFFIFMFLVVTKTKVKIFHPNTKVIAAAVFIWVFLMTLCSGAFYIFELWRITYPFTNACDRLWHTPLLFALRTTFVVSLNGVNASLFVLSIERLICICRISNYEQSSKPVTVAVILILITVLLSILFTLLYMQGVEWNEGMVTTSMRNATNAISYQIMLVYYLIVELSGVFVFIFIHFWCLSYRKRIRGFKSVSQRLGTAHIAKYKSLSVKFQIEETLRMTHIFLPIVVVKLVTNVLTNISSTVTNVLWKIDAIDIQMIVFESYGFSSCLPLFLAIVFAYCTDRITSFCGFFPKQPRSESTVSVRAISNENQDEHFNRLKEIFEMPRPNERAQKMPRIFWIRRQLADSNRVAHSSPR